MKRPVGKEPDLVMAFGRAFIFFTDRVALATMRAQQVSKQDNRAPWKTVTSLFTAHLPVENRVWWLLSMDCS